MLTDVTERCSSSRPRGGKTVDLSSFNWLESERDVIQCTAWSKAKFLGRGGGGACRLPTWITVYAGTGWQATGARAGLLWQGGTPIWWPRDHRPHVTTLWAHISGLIGTLLEYWSNWNASLSWPRARSGRVGPAQPTKSNRCC